MPAVTSPSTPRERRPESTSGSGGRPADADVRASSPGGSAVDPLAAVVHGRSSLATFRTALSAADVDVLEKDGPYTVFAPNNDAFTKLGTRLDALLQTAGTGQLRDTLRFHIVEGTLRAQDLTDGRLLKTLQGGRLRVVRAGTDISLKNQNGTALVVDRDVAASNGVIHEVDTVLEPLD